MVIEFSLCVVCFLMLFPEYILMSCMWIYTYLVWRMSVLHCGLIHNCQTGKITHEFKNFKRWLHKTTANIWYNETCKEKRLTPKYFTIKISDNSRQSINAQKATTHHRINQEIKFLYLKKARLNEQLYKKHLECAATWPRIWTSIQQIIDNNLQGEMEKHYENLNKKN